jgi:hypothetical protein
VKSVALLDHCKRRSGHEFALGDMLGWQDLGQRDQVWEAEIAQRAAT